ncbi:hypothetical protein JKP88DRAFT_307946 [Tribonema minus]|uniref:K Homology domain-containing protein n=1 Tax=Tribonema minus TaxID=303371 RepID=A0A835Z3V4_9STRA|nr:hypothetical protein JKP88DRAFT_307946 [Tribonema minus]
MPNSSNRTVGSRHTRWRMSRFLGVSRGSHSEFCLQIPKEDEEANARVVRLDDVQGHAGHRPLPAPAELNEALPPQQQRHAAHEEVVRAGKVAVASKLAEAQGERSALEVKILETRHRVDAARKRLPRRPREAEKELEDEIAKLEFYRSTNSMSLSKEKEVLRQQDQARAKIKDIKERARQEKDIEALQDKVGALIEESKANTEKVNELSRGLAKVHLAVKAGVGVADLVTATVHVPSDKIGRIIGRSRAALADLEKDCGVVCRERSSSSSGGSSGGGSSAGSGSGDGSGDATNGGGSGIAIDVSGSQAAVDAACARVRAAIATVDSKIAISADVVAALKVSSSAQL